MLHLGGLQRSLNLSQWSDASSPTVGPWKKVESRVWVSLYPRGNEGDTEYRHVLVTVAGQLSFAKMYIIMYN